MHQKGTTGFSDAPALAKVLKACVDKPVCLAALPRRNAAPAIAAHRKLWLECRKLNGTLNFKKRTVCEALDVVCTEASWSLRSDEERADWVKTMITRFRNHCSFIATRLRSRTKPSWIVELFDRVAQTVRT